jgi:poly(ADP-ribose) glycohydrolase
MRGHEAILIEGVRQYTRYSGYGGSFRCDGAPEAPMPAERVLAIDAECYYGRDTSTQYLRPAMLRELTKLRAALSDGGIADARSTPAAFATGNWGCGVFGGDARLKALLQWMAASHSGRAILYFPFGDPRATGLEETARKLLAANATVGQLAKALCDSGADMSHGRAFQAVERLML